MLFVVVSSVMLFFPVGEQAVRGIVAEGRKVAESIHNPQKKQEMLRLCDEVDMLTNQLADLCRKGMVC